MYQKKKMFRLTVHCLKNPVNFKAGQGMITHQFKRLLRKKPLHKYIWDPLPMYNPRALVHTNREVDHFTYEEKRNPHAEGSVYWVPDQRWEKVPVPQEFKDAYWWRDLQARRVQCPVEWVSHRMYSPLDRQRYDFQDLAFRRKPMVGYHEAAENAKRMRT